MALDIFIEAEYADSFVLREDEQDHSPYDSGRNIFHAVLERRPEAAHGPMTRFSLVCRDTTYSIDWTQLPDNARPIRFKHMEATLVAGEAGPARLVGIDFGYQFTDPNGENVQEVSAIVTG